MNILAISAHFDDLELGCGGTLANKVTNGATTPLGNARPEVAP
jgi:LmbE family N-acetylglucosaminyl deacetylase